MHTDIFYSSNFLPQFVQKIASGSKTSEPHSLQTLWVGSFTSAVSFSIAVEITCVYPSVSAGSTFGVSSKIVSVSTGFSSVASSGFSSELSSFCVSSTALVRVATCSGCSSTVFSSASVGVDSSSTLSSTAEGVVSSVFNS